MAILFQIINNDDKKVWAQNLNSTVGLLSQALLMIMFTIVPTVAPGTIKQKVLVFHDSLVIEQWK